MIYLHFKGGLSQLGAMRAEAGKGKPLILVNGAGRTAASSRSRTAATPSVTPNWAARHIACGADVEQADATGFISADGFGITETCRRYLTPLIAGEDYPPYAHGLPRYVTLKTGQ